jgi:hypothetical protein
MVDPNIAVQKFVQRRKKWDIVYKTKSMSRHEAPERGFFIGRYKERMGSA